MEHKADRIASDVVPTGAHSVDAWLRKDVAAVYDALRARPSRAVTVGAVKERLLVTWKKFDFQA